MVDIKDARIDIEYLKKKIESILKKNDTPYGVKIEADRERGEYKIISERFNLTIQISEKWIGYDLGIDKSVLGKTIGTFSDTDGYAIQGEHADVALDKFNEVYRCLHAVLDNEVYVGKDGKELYLALPVSDGEFRMIIRIGYFSGASHLVSREDIEKNQTLHRIFQS